MLASVCIKRNAHLLLVRMQNDSATLGDSLAVAAAAAAAKSLQSCPTLWDPIDSSPGSPVPGILQARTLEWVAISFSNAWKWKVKVKVAQLCPTPSNLMDCSLPGSSIHGICQARVLEWIAIAFSDSLADFHRTKHLLNIWSSSCTPWHLSKGVKNLKSIQKSTQVCLLQLYSRLPRLRCNQDVHQ